MNTASQATAEQSTTDGLQWVTEGPQGVHFTMQLRATPAFPYGRLPNDPADLPPPYVGPHVESIAFAILSALRADLEAGSGRTVPASGEAIEVDLLDPAYTDSGLDAAIIAITAAPGLETAHDDGTAHTGGKVIDPYHIATVVQRVLCDLIAASGRVVDYATVERNQAGSVLARVGHFDIGWLYPHGMDTLILNDWTGRVTVGIRETDEGIQPCPGRIAVRLSFESCLGDPEDEERLKARSAGSA